MFGRLFNGVLFLLAAGTMFVDYGVAEQTRLADVALDKAVAGIKIEQGRSHDLDANFRMLAMKVLPRDAAATVQYASLTQLPRRDAQDATVHEISAPAGMPVLVPVVARN